MSASGRPTRDASGADDIPRCPVCLSPCRADQRYCLECGARLGPPPARRVPRVPLPAGRPSASAIAALVVVALVGIAVAWGLAGGDDDDGARSASSTGRQTTGRGTGTGAGGVATAGSTGAGTSAATLPVTTPATTFDLPPTTFEQPPSTEEPPTTFEEPPPTTDEEPPPTTDEEPPPLEPVDAWVDDGAWAVILISREVGTVDADDMAALEDRAAGRGLRRVGTLLSDNWTTLNPGYWVLYQGPFDSQAAARSAARAAQGKGYPGAYPRRVAS